METSEVIQHMVDDILNNRGADATEKIESILSMRVTDAIADKKIEVAQSLGKDE
jgi:hypothetical protein